MGSALMLLITSKNYLKKILNHHFFILLPKKFPVIEIGLCFQAI